MTYDNLHERDAQIRLKKREHDLKNLVFRGKRVSDMTTREMKMCILYQQRQISCYKRTLLHYTKPKEGGEQ